VRKNQEFRDSYSPGGFILRVFLGLGSDLAPACNLFRWSGELQVALRTHFYCELRGLNYRRQQFPHAHEVIGSSREGEDPPDFENAPMAQLAQERDGLEPAEAFLNALALLLADFVTSVPSGTAIYGAPTAALGVL
jgi:hypothetical protein